MSPRSRDKSRGSSFPSLDVMCYRIEQPGPSSRNVAPQVVERPESPSSPDKIVGNILRVGVEIPLGIGLESSSEDEYEEPSSEKDNGLFHCWKWSACWRKSSRSFWLRWRLSRRYKFYTIYSPGLYLIKVRMAFVLTVPVSWSPSLRS